LLLGESRLANRLRNSLSTNDMKSHARGQRRRQAFGSALVMIAEVMTDFRGSRLKEWATTVVRRGSR
jgi:hypothetical protein